MDRWSDAGVAWQPARRQSHTSAAVVLGLVAVASLAVWLFLGAPAVEPRAIAAIEPPAPKPAAPAKAGIHRSSTAPRMAPAPRQAAAPRRAPPPRGELREASAGR